MTEGDRIRLIRLAKGMNQVEFAQAVDMTASAICHLENGTREVMESIRRNLCTRLQLNPRWLMTGEGEIDQVPEEADELLQAVAQILSANPSLRRAVKMMADTYTADEWRRWDRLFGEKFIVTFSPGPDCTTMSFTFEKHHKGR